MAGNGGHLTPGLVNTRTHLFQAGLRGIGEGLGLLAWLSAVGEEAARLTPERAYATAAAAAAEALRSGTTTLVEHMWPHPSSEVHDAVLRALKDSDVRAVLCRGVADRADPSRRWGFDPRLMQPLEAALAHTDELIAQARGSRVDVGVAVPNPRCLTPKGMGAVRAYAEGRATLARHGVGVSYNPLSNMRLGSGIAPVPEMLEAGLSVGLGVDRAASNDTQDILEALRIGAYLQRAVHRKADLFGFPEMFAMAAGGANRMLGIEENPDGGVRAGTRADLVLHRFDRDHACLPVRDPGATLLTCGSSRTVAAVLVGGEVLVRDGEHVRLPSREPAAGLARRGSCGG
ncbi:amidohydrolase family protein [Streptomyces roseolus]|uniref:amidohydrolase family protein n=1 Tax=Streptomyces roseolus TaxID=67358 RepID=UPI0033CE2471